MSAEKQFAKMSEYDNDNTMTNYLAEFSLDDATDDDSKTNKSHTTIIRESISLLYFAASKDLGKGIGTTDYR